MWGQLNPGRSGMLSHVGNALVLKKLENSMKWYGTPFFSVNYLTVITMPWRQIAYC